MQKTRLSRTYCTQRYYIAFDFSPISEEKKMALAGFSVPVTIKVSCMVDRRDNPDILYVNINCRNNESMYWNFITFMEQSRDRPR